MKKIFFYLLIFSPILYANDGKIDMHGGKPQSLLNEKSSLSLKDINKIGIAKPNMPKEPKEPENLIKKEKKEDKK